MNLSKRNYILTLEAFTGSDTCFIVLLESQLAEVFDEGDEDVFGIVFFEGQVVGGEVFRGGCFLGGEQFRKVSLYFLFVFDVLFFFYYFHGET